MTAWTDDELDRLDGADELGIASRRPDGSVRPFITIWFVRLGGELFVRSAHGYDNPWFQRALKSREGRIRVGDIERDAAFEEPDHALSADLSGAYHAKYDRYGRGIVSTVVSRDAERATLRVVPR